MEHSFDQYCMVAPGVYISRASDRVPLLTLLGERTLSIEPIHHLLLTYSYRPSTEEKVIARVQDTARRLQNRKAEHRFTNNPLMWSVVEAIEASQLSALEGAVLSLPMAIIKDITSYNPSCFFLWCRINFQIFFDGSHSTEESIKRLYCT